VGPRAGADAVVNLFNMHHGHSSVHAEKNW